MPGLPEYLHADLHEPVAPACMAESDISLHKLGSKEGG